MNTIEYEKRFLVEDFDLIRSKLFELGASLKSSFRIVDYWYIPENITSREQHDQWFDVDRGCSLRIRHNISDDSLILGAKKLTSDLNHNSIEEADVKISDIEETQKLLTMLDYKNFLVIDKNREVYEYAGLQICLDNILDFGCGIEVEGSGSSRDEVLANIDQLLVKLEIDSSRVLEKSMTVLAMDKLAKF